MRARSGRVNAREERKCKECVHKVPVMQLMQLMQPAPGVGAATPEHFCVIGTTLTEDIFLYTKLQCDRDLSVKSQRVPDESPRVAATLTR